MEDLVPTASVEADRLSSTPSPTVAEVLNAAADLIEPRGCWSHYSTARRLIKTHQGQIGPEDEACLATADRAHEWGALGAVYKAGRDRGLTDHDCYSLGQHVARDLVVPFLSDWGREPERTQSEVVSALRAAASKQVGGGDE